MTGEAKVPHLDRPIARWLDVHVATGAVERHGIVTPLGTKVVGKTKDTIVIKVPGHGYWSGRGMPQSYAAAEYEVYAIEAEEHTSRGTRYTVSPLAQFPVRS